METKILHYIAIKYFLLAVELIMNTCPWTRLQKSLARALTGIKILTSDSREIITYTFSHYENLITIP